MTTNYGYDSIYQLLSAAQGGTTTKSYSYDPAGNRQSSLGVSSYTVNSSNELTADSNASFSYDNNGNTTSKTDSTGTTNYSWDYENRMTGVTLPGSSGTVSFKYDPLGRRIQKISSTTTSIFVYDGDNLTETVNSTGGTVARYTQGQNIDEPLAMERGTTTDYYEQDGLGSVTSLSSSTGTIAQSYTYDSFGNTTNSSGSLTNFFRYTAREFDTETGLYFLRARYFDPVTGRFISEDPLALLGGYNFYVYKENNPLNQIDPFGLKCITMTMIVTAYSDSGPGKDWPYYAPKTKGGTPGSVGPGTVAVANANPPPYPMGSTVVVAPGSQPNSTGYAGTVHDTGAGWNYPGHAPVAPGNWIDIWLPQDQAIKWGRQTRTVTICTPDDVCKK